MARLVIENILLFLLPTLLYLIFVMATRGDNRQGLLDGAPLGWLMLAGAGLVLAVLATFGSNTNGKPEQEYIPPSMKDGQIQPGRFE